MAFKSRGRPLVGEYWLHSTLLRASLAAFRIKSGGLYPKKPWPMLMIGCLGEAAAASLMMDLGSHVSRTLKTQSRKESKSYQTSCRLPATRAAGFSFSLMAGMERWRDFVRVSLGVRVRGRRRMDERDEFM